MSTSIVIYNENGTVGRLSLFDDTDNISLAKINSIANEWRNYFKSSKIEVIETDDKKCRPNFKG